MVTMQERKEKRRKRLELAYEQTELYELHSKTCRKNCNSCSIAKRLLEIGRELGYEPGYDDDETPIGEVQITVEEYFEYKKQNKTDDWICNEIGCKKYKLIDWKKENNLIREPRKKVVKPQKAERKLAKGFDFISVDEFLKLKQDGYTDVQLAIKLGVSRSQIFKYKEHHNLITGGE